ncbi:MAG TPA: peptide ABC transporter substrate-binding protein, partial [Gemmatimonadaceae bacterium]
ERQHAPVQRDRARSGAEQGGGAHAVISHRSRLASTCAALLLASACIAPQRPDDVIVLASGADLESANPLVTTHPLSRQIQRYALFVTLTRYDSALAHQPYLARSWEWSPDHRRLSMSLVTGLQWHDGAATTARDAVFTLLAAKDPATGYPRASELAGLDTAVAPNDSTLVLSFAAPQAGLPAYLAELPLVPAHRLGDVARSALRSAPFNDAPIGNGPFAFAKRRRGASWSFVRNEHFPAALGGPPALRGLTIAVVDEATTKFAGLASGELDMAGISPQMVPLARRDRTLEVLTYPVLFSNALFFNTTRPPFDEARVRRAVALSIDRGRIVEVALAGFGTPWSGAVPPDNPLAWRAPTMLDTLVADSLLDAAGWRRGADGIRRRGNQPFEVELLTVGTGDNVAEQLVQSDLGARGIKVRVRQTEMGTFLTTARAEQKTFDVLIAGIPGDLSLSYVSALFDSRQRGGTLDYTGFHVPALDDQLRVAADAPPGAARQAAWHTVQAALDTLAPATWLYHARGVQGVSRRVRGARMDLRGELVTVHDWSLAPRSALR